MQEIVDFIAKCKFFFLATIDGDAPQVRPFGTLTALNGHLAFMTANTKPVAHQIEANPNVSICAYDGTTWVRIKGRAFAENVIETNRAMLEVYPNLTSMYSADDGIMQVFVFTSGVAVFSSFDSADRTVEF